MRAAAYVGLRSWGIGGGAASFIGFGLPVCILMLILSALYARTASAVRNDSFCYERPLGGYRIILIGGTFAALFFNVELIYTVIVGILVSLLFL